MYPQDALRLTQKLRALFDKISATEADLLVSLLERFDVEMAETVIRRYSEETATFDRGRLRTLLLEEHSKRTRRVSETVSWRKVKKVETETRDATLDTLDPCELQRLSDDIRNRFGKLLKADPMLSDLGRSLMYQELKGKSSAVKELV
jgi:cell division FtsZ-interacting protein ZapD